jgi:hypothetical protein
VSNKGNKTLPKIYPRFSKLGSVLLKISKAFTKLKIEIAMNIAPRETNNRPKNFFILILFAL